MSKQVATHLRDVFFGSNWTGVNLTDTLKDVTWQQATKKVGDLNTIALLVFHINYYVTPVMKVLQGGALAASDKFSFDMPPVHSAEDWERLTDKFFSEAELLAEQIEKMDDEKLFENFSDGKYGNYLRNVLGVIEHTHYHLGQIVILKKMVSGKPVSGAAVSGKPVSGEQ